jgi:hypothetical protein
MGQQPEGELGKRRRAGMEVGIAEKAGNAAGAKTPTAVARGRTNIHYRQR